MVYQPMLELLAYLRANGFKTFIVSGGGVEFMRPWTERVYGIPPEQVIGSSGKLKLEESNGHPVLIKLPDVDLVDDRPREARRYPEPYRPATHCRVRQLRRRPADAASGPPTERARASRSSCTTTTPQREFAYDRDDQLQQFNAGWDEALSRGLDGREHEERLERHLSARSPIALPEASGGRRSDRIGLLYHATNSLQCRGSSVGRARD